MVHDKFFYNNEILIHMISFLICFMLIIFTVNNSQANSNDVSVSSRPKDISKSIFSDIQTLPILFQGKMHDDVITVISPKNSPLIFSDSPAKSLQSLYVIDVSDYLKGITGFSAIRNGGVNNEPVFRGMFGSRIRILMDNGEILGACFSHMDPVSAYIFPETFDILNIIKGPQTVLWGPVTSAGTLQFERYHPQFDKSKIQLRSNVTIGANNKIDKNIDSIMGSKYGYIRLIGNVSRSDDYHDGNKDQVHSAWYKWNADAILSFNLSADTYLEVSLGQGNGTANYAARSMDGLCFARESYGMKIETLDISKTLDKIELQAWHNYVNHIMADTVSHNTELSTEKCCGFSGNINNNVDRLIWGARGITVSQWDNIKCHSGADVQINTHREHMKSNSNWKTDIVSRDTGIFTELIFDSLSNRRFTGGTRLEYSVINFNNSSKYKRHGIVYPAGFIRYENNINPLLSYYIGVGTSFRLPDYWELFYTKFGENINIDDILKLKPEKTVQVDIGASFQHLQINGWISSYAGYVKDFIVCDYRNDDAIQDAISYAENIRAKICGTEVGLNYQFNEHWHTATNISWVWGMNIDDGCTLFRSPPLEGKITCQWIRGSYSITAKWRLALAQSINDSLMSPGSFVSRNMLPHTDVNCNTSGFGILSMNFAWKSSQFYKFSIGVDNLLNHSYREYLNSCVHKRLGYPSGTLIYEPGRTWWIKLGMEL
ncbi:TonB-dependent copper receptor [Candidatus Blochmanniella pennsylvanica]|uniref:TonB-dependent copper receptor n=1 Tax=Candidatus Blochmanniella pennsylvanica TaxID=101534 RepID=UPI001FF5B3FA|nr:TonB-dependent copper receptor [Candidatus Blochmannia pennsylvanicus]UOY04237.1 TonB-dependent copper receptor [Candidatus Blochmannia pennsylvanicus]